MVRLETGPTQTVVEGEHWDAKPRLATAIGVALRLAPVVAAGLAVWIGSRVLPRPHGWWVATWWIGLVLVAQAVVWLINRWTTRLLPISVLLRMSLAFPDKAPTRISTALRSGNVERLRRQVRHAIDDGLPVDVNEAIVDALALVRALGTHDKGTRGHSERVRAYTDILGEELGLSVAERERLRWGAVLHDVGKLTVPASILNKPGRPTEEEWAILRNHPAEGGRMLAPLGAWLGDALHAADQHHERWDGNGYPQGLSGNDISLAGRIVAVADAFAVMTMARSYKKPYSIEVARRELTKAAGSQFDPMVVRAMLGVSIGRLNKLSGPLAALANIPLIGPLLGPLVSGAPSIPAILSSGATALVATTAGVASFGSTALAWEVNRVPADQRSVSQPAPNELAFVTPSAGEPVVIAASVPVRSSVGGASSAAGIPPSTTSLSMFVGARTLPDGSGEAGSSGPSPSPSPSPSIETSTTLAGVAADPGVPSTIAGTVGTAGPVGSGSTTTVLATTVPPTSTSTLVSETKPALTTTVPGSSKSTTTTTPAPAETVPPSSTPTTAPSTNPTTTFAPADTTPPIIATTTTFTSAETVPPNTTTTTSDTKPSKKS